MIISDAPIVATLRDGAIEVEASALAWGLDLAPAQIPELMRRGEITSICETGVGEDEGRSRLTFFFRNTRLSFVIDGEGRLLQRGRIGFGDQPLPRGLRKPLP